MAGPGKCNLHVAKLSEHLYWALPSRGVAHLSEHLTLLVLGSDGCIRWDSTDILFAAHNVSIPFYVAHQSTSSLAFGSRNENVSSTTMAFVLNLLLCINTACPVSNILTSPVSNHNRFVASRNRILIVFPRPKATLFSPQREVEDDEDDMPSNPQATRISHLAESLSNALNAKSSTLDPSDCLDILEQLQDAEMTRAILTRARMDKILTTANRTFLRQKRAAESAKEKEQWKRVIQQSKRLLETSKETAKEPAAAETTDKAPVEPGHAKTVAEYRARLVHHKADLFKDPPVLPPEAIVHEFITCSQPTRNQQTKELSFVAGAKHPDAELLKGLLRDFHPIRTPKEILQAGAFGGTYFRPIVSSVTNISYKSKDVLRDTIDKDWIAGISLSTHVTSKTYRNEINKYGVKCGGSLGMWESSGWITSIDPYGWFQWYCRFYQGRRSSDDVRQIRRWLKSAGPKGRFRSQLCNKILSANTTHNDATISPVIRQTLLHWGLEITDDILEKHRRRVQGR